LICTNHLSMKITLTCECGGVMKRVPEVIDVWFDSGAMPFAQDHYPFKNKDWVDGPGFPADYISEAIDQTRGWFYTLHAVGILMGKGAAYKNVISLGHLLDKNGKKMSKSLGNVVNPWDMMDKYGVDVLRFWMYSINQPGDSKNFDEKTVDEIVKKVPNLLLNVLSFYQMYAQEDVAASNTSKNVLDQWILALLAELSNNATKGLDTFNVLEPARAIREFIAELSQWYLRRSRDRFKSDDVEDKKNALATTRYVLQELSKLLAPFMPFLAEEIYQKVKGSDGKESVHLENWVEVKEVNQKVLEDMAEARKVVTLALEARAKANQKIRQPLQKLSIKSELLKGNTELLDVIRDEVNVKEVISDTSIENEVDLDTTITPELKLEGQARELLRALQDMRKKMGLNPQDQIALTLDTNDAGKEVFESFKNEIAKTAQITDVMFATLKEGFGEEVKVDDLTFKVQIVKK
jgi:isoleucyl-tRNA synthetase